MAVDLLDAFYCFSSLTTACIGWIKCSCLREIINKVWTSRRRVQSESWKFGAGIRGMSHLGRSLSLLSVSTSYRCEHFLTQTMSAGQFACPNCDKVFTRGVCSPPCMRENAINIETGIRRTLGDINAVVSQSLRPFLGGHP